MNSGRKSGDGRFALRAAWLAPLLGALAQSGHAQINTASYWDQPLGRSGAGLATLGDVSGNGLDDFFMGEPLYDTATLASAGRAFIIDPVLFYWTHLHEGTQADERLGSGGCGIGDADGDGWGDYVVGSPGWNTPFFIDAGKVVAYSGMTGAVIWTVTGLAANEAIGAPLARLPDFDGDGVDDVIVGIRAIGVVRILSGRDGSLLQTMTRGPNTDFAISVASCGDVDGDGNSDVVVGEPGYDSFFPPALDLGRAAIYSTKTGSFLAHVTGISAGDAMGTAVASCGDHDGDGLADFLASMPGNDTGGSDAGMVLLISAAHQSGLQKATGDAAGWRLGLSVAGMGDFDGDGRLDFMAGSPSAGATGRGLVRVYSGADAHVLYAWEGVTGASGDYVSLGETIAAGDWNGDKLGDLVWADPDYTGDYGYGAWESRGAVNTFISCPASWANYGAGWPGRLGVPAFYALNDPAIGGIVEAQVDNSLGADTLAVLYLGTAPTSILTNKGGTLLVTPDILTEVFPLPAAGLTLEGEIPFDFAICGLQFFAQVLEADVYASKKLSFSPGLQLTIGIDQW